MYEDTVLIYCIIDLLILNIILFCDITSARKIIDSNWFWDPLYFLGAYDAHEWI